MGPKRSYRGKRIYNDKWWYGSYLFLHVRDRDWTGKEVGKAEDVHYIVDDQDLNYGVSPATIGMRTGRTDKNGKDIYEGDILAGEGSQRKRDYFEVWWSDANCGFVAGRGKRMRPNMNQATMDHYEIVGNIHDNPEILGGNDGTTD